MDEVGLGKRLQQARKKAGLTQQELCQKANLSYSTLAKIERGAIKAPSIFTIQNIAAALGTDMNELMGVLSPSTPLAANTKKRSKSGIRFAYFDINGCLVRFFHRAFSRLAEETGVQSDVIETAFWHYNDAVCRGELPLADFNRILAERLGIEHLDWQEYYMQAVEPIPEMRELVAWASQNYQIGLLSNIMPGFIKIMMERDLLPRLPFSTIIDSSEVHAIKPEMRIFETAQQMAGVEPQEILFVDDSRTNIMAAESMGWHVLWFDDYRPDESVARVRDALEPED
ncbi:MAG TPA: HAD-IA family hydrolase [Patescibacteria group bacterium]|nr:HAD-IA family hydrolase [Patescibacteria group bacterium]